MLGAMLAAKDPQTGAQMTEAEVKDNVITFIFGGQETTSTALTWAIYLLSQSPEWRERLTEEAENAADGSGQDAALVQTRAVVEEALRLYPPIIGITRTAMRRTELAGHKIERGTMVVISPYVLHRHRVLWRDPDLFDPSRFLPGAARAIERYAYLPFGVGPRVCIGAAFALQEATLVLATLMRQLRARPGARPIGVAGHQFHPATARRPAYNGEASSRATGAARSGIARRPRATAGAVQSAMERPGRR
jgi:cytochrome P450